jgi:ankyrin repeat protein
VVKLLLENGAKINSNGYSGWTPLQQGILFILLIYYILNYLLFKLIASRSGKVEVVKVLLEKGAYINKNGYTPLSLGIFPKLLT